MRPVLPDELTELVQRPRRDGVRHFTREPGHPRQRTHHVSDALVVGVEHGGDRRTGDSRLPGVRDDASSLELRGDGIPQWKRTDVDAVGKGESEYAAECGRVVILPAASNAKLVYFHAPTASSERLSVQDLLPPGSDRRLKRDANRRGAAEAGAGRETRRQRNAYALETRPPHCGAR